MCGVGWRGGAEPTLEYSPAVGSASRPLRCQPHGPPTAAACAPLLGWAPTEELSNVRVRVGDAERRQRRRAAGFPLAVVSSSRTIMHFLNR